MIFWCSIFIISLFVLIKASEYFTDSAEKIGLYMGIPTFIVGVTIVAFGTSLPELISSIIAALKGSSEIVVANVIGSNITNIFLVLSIAAIVGKHLKIAYELIHVDLPIFIGSAFLLGITIWDGVFTFFEALICFALFVVYVLYTVTAEKNHQDFEIKKEMIKEISHPKKLDKAVPYALVLSGFFIYLGAQYTIESVIQISQLIGIGVELIALSAIALGTSLPEVVVTVSAAKKGKPEIAVGNILGSNIFNSLAVMGVPALFTSLVIPPTIRTTALPIMIIGTLLYVFVTQDKEITRWEGWMLLVFYFLFIGSLFAI